MHDCRLLDILERLGNVPARIQTARQKRLGARTLYSQYAAAVALYVLPPGDSSQDDRSGLNLRLGGRHLNLATFLLDLGVGSH
jgi:hypothetical protein